MRLLTLKKAYDEIGQKEVKPNWSSRIREYLEAAGIKSPAPWCMAFVGWCAEKAAAVLGVVSPLESVRLQAYVEAYYQWAVKNDLLIPAEEAMPGDMMLLYYPSLKRHGHVGLVWKVDHKARQVEALEGNTNQAGSREGNIVAHKIRPLTKNVKFVRWTRKVQKA